MGEIEVLEGSYEEIKQALLDKVSGIHEKHNFIKIGKSSNPENRFTSVYQPNGYDNMLIVYKSTRQADIESAEENMLEHFINDLKVLNLKEGSAGDLSETGPHYLYVAVSNQELHIEILKAFIEKLKLVIEWQKEELQKFIEELKERKE